VKRRLLALLLVILGSSAILSADTLQDIDRAVARLGDFIRRTIPDEENQNLTILPFLSDEQGKVTLGDRLKSELELFLAAEYRRTRIIPRPEGANTYTVSGELQSYPKNVRIICRVSRPDGSLGGGTRVDIPSTPELRSLLQATGIEQPALTEAGRSEPQAEDPFEPDDAPGFEVQVPALGAHSFGRAITPGDVDRFRFYNSGAGTVVLEVRTNIDVQLLLYREGENIPFEVSGTESSTNLRLETTLDEGYYVVELLAYDFGVHGSYVFSIDLSGSSNDNFEPDDRLADAGSIRPDTHQDRTLLSGDQDWVELSYTAPGFYALYTTGTQADTRIALYTDQEREILADDDSGAGDNAFIPLFLGTRRLYARVSAQEPEGGAARGGAYSLVFERIDPPQIFPSSGIQQVEVKEHPLSFQLRIIQSGKYLIRTRGEGAGGAPAAAELFSLPFMRPVSGADFLYSLPSGDYLFVLDSEQAQIVRFCITPEADRAGCLGLNEE
jgi:hypothetical protein